MKRRGLLTTIGLAVGAVGLYVTTTTWDSSRDTNAPPEVGAMVDASGFTQEPFAVACPCADDGKPLPPTLSCSWAKTAGPGTCEIDAACSAMATCDTAGALTLQCTCSDGLADDTGTLTATVTFRGWLDRYIAAGGTAANFWVDVSQRVTADYSGPLLRARRASDSTELDVGYVTASGALDVGALGAHCASTHCFVRTAYDQSGNARHFERTVTTYQPKIWDAEDGLITHGSGTPAIFFGGAASTALTQAAHGLSGATALTVAADSNPDQIFESLTGFWTTLTLSGTSRFISRNRGKYASIGFAAGHVPMWAARRLQDASGYIYTVAAGAQLQNATIEQNGVGLVYNANAGSMSVPTETLDLTSPSTSYWGATNEFGSTGVTGRHTSVAAWPVVVTGAPLTVLREYHESLVGDGETARDVVVPGSPFAIVTGQSNAEAMRTSPSTLYAEFPADRRIGGWSWGHMAFGGTSVALWQPGVVTNGISFYAELLALAQLADPTQRLAFFWIQGESDATDASSPLHRGRLRTLVSSLETDLGRDFLWLDVVLHEDCVSGTPAGRATVSADKIELATERGVHGGYIDPDLYGELQGDFVHYMPALQDAMLAEGVTRCNAYAP